MFEHLQLREKKNERGVFILKNALSGISPILCWLNYHFLFIPLIYIEPLHSRTPRSAAMPAYKCGWAYELLAIYSNKKMKIWDRKRDILCTSLNCP